jgi:rhodanese-related sulfurtransferase
MLSKLFIFLLSIVPLVAYAHSHHKTHQQVDVDQLKSWYDQKKPMVVLDARSKPYFDGVLLPNAKWVPAEATDAEIEAAVPSKDSLIVVYCYGLKCPASGWLYDKLVKLGYKNIYEFRGGIEEWIQKGYPTTKQ